MARETANREPKFDINNTDGLNIHTYNDYLNRIGLIAKSMFIWEGLPQGCNERYLEEALYREGRAVFFYDEEYGFMTLKVNPTNQFNVYGEPTDVKASGHNGFIRDISDQEYVYIRNNEYEIPTLYTTRLFAYRLANAERTIDTNVNNQKFPLVIITDDKQKLSMKSMYQKVATNEPVIFGVKGLDLDSIKTLDTSAPYVADKLQDYKHQIWNEVMNFLGINNANTDKRERLISDEVNANNEQIMFSVHTMLKTREEACEQINKMFGLNVSVKLRKLEFEDHYVEEEPVKEDEVNG